MKEGICKLCLERKPLCKESHIYPKFTYRMLKDGPNGMAYYHPGKKVERKFNGEYEANILCQACENYLGKFDDYGAGLIYNLGVKQKRGFQMENGFTVLKKEDGYVYKTAKLFFLSVLWRASISSRPFFNNFSLDKEIEEDIRKIILAEGLWPVEQYACYMSTPPLKMHVETKGFGFDGDEVLYTSSVMMGEAGDIKFAEFFITGMRHRIVINGVPSDVASSSLQEDRLQIRFRTREDQDKINQYIKNIAAQNSSILNHWL